MESACGKNCIGRCSQENSDENYGECVVAIHVLPIKGTPQAKVKVLDETEPTLSVPMLVANGNKVTFKGEVATLITAQGEAAPLMNAGNDWYFKVLINNSTEFMRIDVWTPCHVCPPSWVRNLSPEMKQRERCIVREQTGRKDYENDWLHTNFQKGHTNDSGREHSWTEIQKRDSSIGGTSPRSSWSES